MRLLRWSVLALAGLFLSASTADAAVITIDVAEVTWTVEGVDCSTAEPDLCLSVFTLKYLWLDGLDPGPDPAPTLISGEFFVDGGSAITFDPVDPITFTSTSVPVPGLPGSANATVFFEFLGTQTIGPNDLIPVADLFLDDGTPSPLGIAALFQFEFDDSTIPVPEPSALALVTLGLIAVSRRRRRQ